MHALLIGIALSNVSRADVILGGVTEHNFRQSVQTYGSGISPGISPLGGFFYFPDAIEQIAASGLVSVNTTANTVTYSGFDFQFPSRSFAKTWDITTGFGGMTTQVDLSLSFDSFHVRMLPGSITLPITGFTSSGFQTAGLQNSAFDYTESITGSWTLTSGSEAYGGDFSVPVVSTQANFGAGLSAIPNTANITDFSMFGNMLFEFADGNKGWNVLFDDTIAGHPLQIRFNAPLVESVIRSPVVAVPEPLSLAVLTIVVGALGWRRRQPRS